MLATASDCLRDLVGLSAAGSACFPLPTVTPPATTDYITKSDSGLFVDQVEGLSLKPAQNVTAGSNVYQRLANARNQAMNLVSTELGRSLNQNLGAPIFGQSGLLGGAGDGRVAPLGSLARLELPTRYRAGGGWQLTALQLYTDIAADEAAIWLDGQQLITTISTNTNGFIPLTDVFIPFDGQVHSLEAALPDGVRPKLNTLTCGCSNPWVLSVSNNLAPGSSTKAPAGGFAVQAREVCLEGPMLCYAMGQDEEIKRSVGFALQYKTAEILLVGFLAEGGYNRYTSLEPKNMQAVAERC